MTNLDSVLKSWDITLPTKVCIVKAMVWSSQWSHEARTVKKAEHQRIDAFELWFWRRFLKVPWTARRSNQSILREINPEYSLKDWCWKLKFQYFEGIRGWDGWMVSLMQWIWTLANSRRRWWTGRPSMLQSMGLQWVGHNRVTEQQHKNKYSVWVNLMWHMVTTGYKIAWEIGCLYGPSALWTESKFG